MGSVEIEKVYFKSYDAVREAKMLIGNYFSFYNQIRLH